MLHAPTVAAWPDPRGHGAVVALGSDRSVHASKDPWIGDQVAFLRAAHDAGVPVVGICFGGQALAAALGATVAPRAARPRSAGSTCRATTATGGRWFTWHEDAFDLPPGATELARARSGLQAFAAGPSVGLQFHPEVTPAIVEDWLDGAPGAVADPGPHARRDRETVAAARERAFALMDRIAARWPR